jgi:hypothetical protein
MSRRHCVPAAAALILAACSAPTAPADVAPAFAKGASGTPAAITPSLAGHWKQSNEMLYQSVLGTTHSWYEFDATQSGGTLAGSAVRHSIVYNADGSVAIAEFTGSPGKVSGTVKADSTATVIFNRIEETKITLSYAVKLNADGTLTVLNPVANGPQSFTR